MEPKKVDWCCVLVEVDMEVVDDEFDIQDFATAIVRQYAHVKEATPVSIVRRSYDTYTTDPEAHPPVQAPGRLGE